jgi:hypothetical protein
LTYTLSLHDALPIWTLVGAKHVFKNSLYSENPFSTGSPAERSIVIGDNIDLDPSMSGHATRAWSQN